MWLSCFKKNTRKNTQEHNKPSSDPSHINCQSGVIPFDKKYYKNVYLFSESFYMIATYDFP